MAAPIDKFSLSQEKMPNPPQKRRFNTEEVLEEIFNCSDDENDDLDEVNDPESDSDYDDISPSTAVPEVLEECPDVEQDLNESFEQSSMKRKLVTSKKIVKSIDASLEEGHFSPVDLPESERVFTAYLEKPKNKKDPGKKIKWSNQRPVEGRQSQSDVIRGPIGVKGAAKRATKPQECWNLFFTKAMVNSILRHTNKRIFAVRKRLSAETLSDDRYTYIRDTTPGEITAWIGLLYLRGLLCLNNHSTECLFSDKTGHPVFSATMAKNRFKFLMANVRFDDEETRAERWSSDRFAAFREVFEMFSTQCGKVVSPDDYLSLDETLYPMRNQVSFKQFNPSKPAKYGLLFKSINAARYP